MSLGEIAYGVIEENRGRLWDLAKRIWDNPEGPNREYNACKWQSEMLAEAGFTVETGEFGAMMNVSSVNDGPVTILFDTETL